MNAISISLAVNVPLGNDGLSGSTIRNASACVVGVLVRLAWLFNLIVLCW